MCVCVLLRVVERGCRYCGVWCVVCEVWCEVLRVSKLDYVTAVLQALVEEIEAMIKKRITEGVYDDVIR